MKYSYLIKKNCSLLHSFKQTYPILTGFKHIFELLMGSLRVLSLNLFIKRGNMAIKEYATLFQNPELMPYE